MNNDNPSTMSNMDLEKDAENIQPIEVEGQILESEPTEFVQRIVKNNQHENAERDPDDLVHADTLDQTVKNGVMPDPEAIQMRDTDFEDNGKINGD